MTALAHRQTLFITGARAPVALHLARLLAGAGHEVHLGDSLQRPLGASSRRIAGYHRLPGLGSTAAAPDLAAALTRLKIDWVLPSCEEVLHLARIWRDQPMPAQLFAPEFAVLERVHHKHRFIELCQEIGLNAPQTQLLRAPSEVAALAQHAKDLVFKPVWSRFATQTLVAPNLRALAGVTPTPDRPWVAQELIRGDEFCVYAVARGGQVTALAAYHGLIRAGLGASVCFAPIEDPAIDRFVAQFVAATGWTGQISFDLIRRPDGSIWPIECNPRATSGVHFFRAPAGFSTALLGGAGGREGQELRGGPETSASTGLKGVLRPDVTRPQGLRLALWLYGAPQVFGTLGWTGFQAARREVEEVMDWPGDRFSLWQQLWPLTEIAALAWRQKISLQAASTADLEWNGTKDSAAL